MFPWWEQALDLAAVASSPVRTESQAGLGDLASLHVTVKVLRPHVSGRRRKTQTAPSTPFAAKRRTWPRPRNADRPLITTGRNWLRTGQRLLVRTCFNIAAVRVSIRLVLRKV